MRILMPLGLIALCLCLTLPVALASEQARFVGAESCADCHEEQYESYMKNSQKSHSWKSLEKMLPKLTEQERRECYQCHTTGYGQPGGFVSIEQTPELANLSCEVCHGPGSLHSETGDIDEIQRKPDIKNCLVCHNSSRIQNFNFKPTLYHGGH